MSASSGYISGRQLALVVETDPLLRRLTSTILRQSGFRVREGEQFINAGESIDLVVMSIEPNTAEVIRRVLRNQPHARFILTGAVPGKAGDAARYPRANVSYLSAPFSFARLSQVACSVCDEAIHDTAA